MLSAGNPFQLPHDFLTIPLVILREDGAVEFANNRSLDVLRIRRDTLSGLPYQDIGYLKPLEKEITKALSTMKTSTQKQKIDDRSFEVTISPFELKGRTYITLAFFDTSPFLMLERDLLKRNKELMIMNTLSGAFISSENIEGVFSDLLEKILLVTDFPSGTVMIKSEKGYELKSHTGISRKLQRELREGGLAEYFLPIESMKDPLYVFEGEEIRENPALAHEGIRVLVAVPIRVNKVYKGVILLASRTQRALDFDLASILSLIGGQLSLIVEKIDLFEETRRLSITDSLTGLFNSRYFYQELEREIARAKRYKHSFTLAILDIDDFKKINDTYGHPVGDEILVHVSSALKSASRETDSIARYGGEEFVIIFPNTSKSEALAVSERIMHSINESAIMTTQGNPVNVTISGGLASYPMDGTTANELLSASDKAMYRAKASGKKQIVCYNSRL